MKKIIIGIAIFLLTTQITHAQVYIKSFLPNPEGSDSLEWIEIKNSTSEDINLKNWQLDDDEGGSKSFMFKTHIIKGNNTLKIFQKESKIKLNNDIDKARLINPEGEIIHEISYKNAKSGQIFPQIQEQNTKQYQIGDFTDNIEITELMPNPKGTDKGNEWVELYNFSGKDINLQNWQLGTERLSNITIKKDEYLKITPKNLRNQDYKLELLDPNKKQIDAVEYKKALDGMSYAKINYKDEKKWEWTFEETAGKENPTYEILLMKATETENIIKNTYFKGKIKDKEIKVILKETEINPKIASAAIKEDSQIEIKAKKLDPNTYELKNFEVKEPAKEITISKKSPKEIITLTLIAGILLTIIYTYKKYKAQKAIVRAKSQLYNGQAKNF